jgi:hypothetical protein
MSLSVQLPHLVRSPALCLSLEGADSLPGIGRRLSLTILSGGNQGKLHRGGEVWTISPKMDWISLGRESDESGLGSSPTSAVS